METGAPPVYICATASEATDSQGRLVGAAARRIGRAVHRIGHAVLADPLIAWKHTLYQRAAARAEELARAAHALFGAAPTEEQQADFLDFFCIEWVDAAGYTEVDLAVAAGEVPAEALRWPREVRTALWVVDGWEGEIVLLRDVATEAEQHVYAPEVREDLPRRAVLRARVIPVGDTYRFSGAPDVWEPMGVLARMEVLQGWVEGGEPALGARLTALRAGFLQQREERAAWIAWFEADEVVFPDAHTLEIRLAGFVSFLHNEHPFPSLGGRTRAATHRAEKGDEPKIIQLTLGSTLTGPGRPGVIYDAVEGIHFLPFYGEVRAHLRGEESHPERVRAYLDDPGITRLPFLRTGHARALADLLGMPGETPLEFLLEPYKPLSRAAPSVLPSLDD